MKKKFQVETSRVKGACFHPSKPWILTSLHSGQIMIWDYNMKIIIAKFDEGQGPVRGADFHPHLPLFVTGADTGDIRVWNYKHKRCSFALKGHIDYVRTVYFHHQLPWILSACDDQTMRIWNYQSRSCINIITGHAHYVMCAQFHPQKNLIVSASLDSTVRIWDFEILRKKMTQTKNASAFIGIEIQCIKVLEGHERGCNWVTFHPSQNIIASCSDDKKIKLWKYTHEVAWQHSTILGHKSNVSSLAWDPTTLNLISNSEDKTTRVWNIESKTDIIVEKRSKARYWIVSVKKNGTLLASGHDEGLDIFVLNKQRVPHALISKSLIVFAQGMTSYLYDVTNKKQNMQLYQYKPKDKNANVFIQKIISNPFEESVFMVQINELGENFYMIKKKQNYLNFPTVFKDYSALDSCFISKTRIAILASPRQIKFTSFVNKTEAVKTLSLKDPFSIHRIFHSDTPDQLIFVTTHNNCITKFDVNSKKPIGQEEIEDTDVRAITHGFGKIAVMCKMSILITTSSLQKVVSIRQKFPIKSCFWESSDLLFYTTTNHLKYAFMNGQTGVMKTIEEPLHLLLKLKGNKFLAFNERQKIFQLEFPDYKQIEFKMALNDKDFERVKGILNSMGKTKKKILIKYLVEKGYAQLGLDLVTDVEQKFSLAIQSSNFQLAFELCSKVNTQQYWKMLGEQALKQGIYEGYELSCQKLKNLDQLNFLYSLQSNTQKLTKLARISKKSNNHILSYNCNLFLNNSEGVEQILRDVGMSKLAQLCHESQDPQHLGPLLKKLKSRPLTPCQAVGEDNTANWPHVVDEDEEQDEEGEEAD